MTRDNAILALIAVAVGVFVYSEANAAMQTDLQTNPQTDTIPPDFNYGYGYTPQDTALPATDYQTPIFESGGYMSESWKVGEYPKYAALITQTETDYGLPNDLLARLLYQESHYRADIISGATKSPAGALGIAQFMPATANDLRINPLDPNQAIPAAARYLVQMFRIFGNWSAALGAYNFGAGNYRKYLNGQIQLPTETRNYIAQITNDVGIA